MFKVSPRASGADRTLTGLAILVLYDSRLEQSAPRELQNSWKMLVLSSMEVAFGEPAGADGVWQPLDVRSIADIWPDLPSICPLFAWHRLMAGHDLA